MSPNWIGAGLDPEKSTFFVQSARGRARRAYLLLSMVIAVPWLERVPTYKEQRETLKDKDLSTIGFSAIRCCRPLTSRCTMRGSSRSATIRSHI